MMVENSNTEFQSYQELYKRDNRTVWVVTWLHAIWLWWSSHIMRVIRCMDFATVYILYPPQQILVFQSLNIWWNTWKQWRLTVSTRHPISSTVEYVVIGFVNLCICNISKRFNVCLVLSHFTVNIRKQTWSESWEQYEFSSLEIHEFNLFLLSTNSFLGRFRSTDRSSSCRD